MGLFLINESMFDSVLFARKNILKKMEWHDKSLLINLKLFLDKA
jgi:hypothetical protein